MPSSEILLALLLWASSISGITIPQNRNPLPIEIVSTQEIDPLKLGWRASTHKYTGQIQISDAWTDRGVDTYCLLAHEYTHWLQVVNNIPMNEPTEIEPPAYRVAGVCFEYYGDLKTAKWAYDRSKFCMINRC